MFKTKHKYNIDTISKNNLNYINHNDHLLNIKNKNDSLKYWSEYLSSSEQNTAIFSILNSNDNNECSYKEYVIPIDNEKVESIKNELNISSEVFFNSLWGIILSIYNESTDVIFSTAISTIIKELNEFYNITNDLPIRIKINSDDKFCDIVSKVEKYQEIKSKYYYLSFDSIKEKCKLDKLSSESLTVNCDDQNTINYILKEKKYNFLLCFSDKKSKDLKIIYNTNKFKDKEISRISSHIETAISTLSPNLNVIDFEVLSESEKELLITNFGSVKQSFNSKENILTLFNQQVSRTPNKTAIVFNNQKVTYKELDMMSNVVANYLLSIKSIQCNDLIGILLNRSEKMIIAILGILKSGAAYIPLDPEFPKDRIEYMLQDSNPVAIISNHTRDKHINIDDILNSNDKCEKKVLLNIDNTNYAYIIYTSGSTGKPKGTIISHKSLLNFVLGISKEINFAANKNIISVTTFSFDIFVLETFIPLSKGQTIIIASEEQQKDPYALQDVIEKNNVNMIQTTPSRIKILTHDPSQLETLLKLTDIMIGGEPFPVDLLKMFNEKYKGNLYNMYGPTETTVWSTMSKLNNTPYVHIGKPILNTDIYILNRNNKLVPVGQLGEIHIAGDGLSLGYLNRPDLTSEKFIKSPFNDQILYKTGDLGRWRSDGNLEISGRIDTQIKFRGYRIELTEIENVILKINEIKEVVVLLNNNNGIKNLVAYFNSSIKYETSELKEILIQELPNYMVPSYFIYVDKFPLTPNGKVDKKKLQIIKSPKLSNINRNEERTETEETLHEIWKEILDLDFIGIEENFFEFGGNSLIAANIISRIKKRFNKLISLTAFFNSPTIKSLGKLIENTAETQYVKIEKELSNREYYPVSFAQLITYILIKKDNSNLSYNMPSAMVIDGDFNLSKINEIYSSLIKRHESLRTSFHMINNEVVQKVHDNVEFNVSYQEIYDIGSNIDDSLKSIVYNFIESFDFEKPPLLRVKIVKFNQSKYLLLFDMHHIISDGVSVSTLNKEFFSLYQNIALDSLETQYKDYSLWEQKMIESPEFNKQKEFWKTKFKEVIPHLTMPIDYKRKDKLDFKGNTFSSTIPEDKVVKLEKLSKKYNVTNNIILYTIYKILIHKYTGQNDITIGSITANRNQECFENVVGMFANYLPIRNKINPLDSFEATLIKIKNSLLEFYDNGEYPYEKIIEDITFKLPNNRNPLFDTMMVYHNHFETTPSEYRIDDITFKNYLFDKNTTTLDFKLDIYPNNKKLLCEFEYRTSLYKLETIKQLSQDFEKMIDKILIDPQMKIEDFKIFNNDKERKVKENREKINTNNQKVVISSTFTSEPVIDVMKYWNDEMELDLNISFSPYNQVFQQLLDLDSITNLNNDGYNILLVRFEDWIRYDDNSTQEKVALLENYYKKFITALNSYKSKSPIYVALFPIASHIRFDQRVIKTIENLTVKLAEELKSNNKLYYIDLRKVEKLYNIKKVFEPIKDKEGHIPFTDEYYNAMGTSIIRAIRAYNNNKFKVIVLDCDNTLWSGVCGEDGSQGVIIDQYYRALQEFILQKYNEGMLLVISSKNNEQDVWDVFKNNKNMILKKEHFVSARINWNRKSESIISMAQELNLGTDSFIFLDDNTAECFEVMSNLPEVLTLQIPENRKLIPNYINHVWAFDKISLTLEDKNRSKMYQANKKRNDAQKQHSSINDFIKNLDLKMSMNLLIEDDIERISQLTKRTNQFNLSTIRRSVSDIEELLNSSNKYCWTIKVKDKFGDYGLVGVVIAENNNNTMHIDTFLLSCRVLGRSIEHQILSGLKLMCKSKNINYIYFKYKKSVKNEPIRIFLNSLNADNNTVSSDITEYILNCDNIKNNNSYIDFFYNENIPQVKNNGADSINYIESKEKVYKTPNNWEIKTINDNNLLHKKELLPLKYSTGEKLQNIPFKSKVRSNKNYIKPRNDFEVEVIEIWERMLKISNIGINDNFFELGGNSIQLLKITFEINQLGYSFSYFDVLDLPTISSLSDVCSNYIINEKDLGEHKIEFGSSKDNVEKILNENKNISKIYPLTSMQSSVLGYNIMHYKNGANTQSMKYFFNNISINDLKNNINKVIKRHDILRSSFKWKKLKEPLILIKKDVDYQIDKYDLSKLDQNDLKVKLESIQKEQCETGFNVEGELFKISLVKVNEYSTYMIFTYLNSIIDEWSLNVIIDEISNMYNKTKNILELHNYNNYIHWLQNQNIEKAKEFWVKEFEYFKPFNIDNKAISSNNIAEYEFKLTNSEINIINNILKKERITLNALLMGIWGIIYSKNSNNKDIIIGMVTSVRPSEITNASILVGLFTNILPIRLKVPESNIDISYLQDINTKLNKIKRFDYPGIMDIAKWTKTPLKFMQNIINNNTINNTSDVNNNSDMTFYNNNLLTNMRLYISKDSISIKYNPDNYTEETIYSYIESIKFYLEYFIQ